MSSETKSNVEVKRVYAVAINVVEAATLTMKAFPSDDEREAFIKEALNEAEEESKGGKVYVGKLDLGVPFVKPQAGPLKVRDFIRGANMALGDLVKILAMTIGYIVMTQTAGEMLATILQ
jgi:hypothetical protein